MTEKLLYEDGCQVSLSYATELIQNLMNNQVRNTMRLLTLTPGFFGTSFYPEGIEQDPSSPSVAYVRMQAGPVVFPNGEVFGGQNFVLRIPVERKDGYQYIKVVYHENLRTRQTYAFNQNGNYAEVLDGVKIMVADVISQTVSGNDLLIAKVSFGIDDKIPQVTDIRNHWTFYWSGAEIVNSAFTIQPISVEEKPSFDLKSTDSGMVPAHIISGDVSLLNILSIDVCDVKHYDNIRLLANHSEFNDLSHNRPPFVEKSNAEVICRRYPAGITSDLQVKRIDAYRGGIHTQWSEPVKYITGSGAISSGFSVSYSLVQCETMPVIGLKFWTESDLGPKFFIQLWISDSEINDETVPNYEIPFSYDENTGDEIPYFLYHYTIGSTILYFKYRVIGMDQRVAASDNGTIPLESSGSLNSDSDVFMLPIGCDRMENSHPIIIDPVNDVVDLNGSRCYFSSSGGYENPVQRFYLPRGPKRGESSVEDADKRYIRKIDFYNYAPTPLSIALQKPGVSSNILWTATNNGAGSTRIECQDKEPYDPLNTGDWLTVSESDTVSEIANGTYLITNEGTSGAVQHYYDVAFAGQNLGGGLCKIHVPSASVARLVIKDLTDLSISEFLFSSLDIGAKEIKANADAVSFINACSPEGPFEDSWTPTDPLDYELIEGHWYEVYLEYDAGINEEYMDIMGGVKLYLSKKVSY